MSNDRFPSVRLRRLRRTHGIRSMLDMSVPSIQKMIWPVFLFPGSNQMQEISSMPGQYRFTLDKLLRALKDPVSWGLGGILIFGVPEHGKKDAKGESASDPNGITQKSILAIKKEYPGLTIFTDVCLCAYTDHGHCGPLSSDGDVDNSGSLEQLSKVALSHAYAGADAVAPSAMMDGQVKAIRTKLDENGFTDTILMSYSTKFASSMYGPFREAEGSAPSKGDRKSYQASYSDLRTALRESVHDESEGADILMVKPSLFYLDVISRIRQSTNLPIAAYNVSGEYSMMIAMADRGWGDLRGMVRESMVALSRAGTDIIITYWASRYKELIA